MIYLYAVAATGGELPELAGIDDAAVERREIAGLMAAVSEHPRQPEPSQAALLRHAHVVESLARDGAPVLPVRFGAAFADEASLERELLARASELAAALERVRGCAEIGLRVLRPAEPQPTETPADGRGYMRVRLHETNERERLAHVVHDALARHARDSTRGEAAGGRVLLSAAYLVPHEEIDPFRRTVTELERTHPELALVCTGPWPPYSFAPAGTGAA